MIIVSDASPLIALHAVGKVSLLQELFGVILIPPAVYDEVFTNAAAAQLPCPEFIRVESLSTETSSRFLNMSLHIGESEAIALALEKSSDCILLDDKLARVTAARLGLQVIGTLGVLLLAKQKGRLEAVRPVILELIDKISFRISPTIVNRALSHIGEPPL